MALVDIIPKSLFVKKKVKKYYHKPKFEYVTIEERYAMWDYEETAASGWVIDCWRDFDKFPGDSIVEYTLGFFNQDGSDILYLYMCIPIPINMIIFFLLVVILVINEYYFKYLLIYFEIVMLKK